MYKTANELFNRLKSEKKRTHFKLYLRRIWKSWL